MFYKHRPKYPNTPKYLGVRKPKYLVFAQIVITPNNWHPYFKALFDSNLIRCSQFKRIVFQMGSIYTEVQNQDPLGYAHALRSTASISI